MLNQIYENLPALVTADQMAKIDRLTIGDDPETGYELMSRAGEALFLMCCEILKLSPQLMNAPEEVDDDRVYSTLSGSSAQKSKPEKEIEVGREQARNRSVLVLCGKGNNGGDGLVLARLLKNAGVNCKVVLCGAKDALQNEAARALEDYTAEDYEFDLADESAFNRESELNHNNYDLVVDALLGTGSQGSPRGLISEAIQWIVGHAELVLSVDLPSGYDVSAGEPFDLCVSADYTMMFGVPRYDAVFDRSGCYGVVRVADLGYPPEIVEAVCTDDSAGKVDPSASFVLPKTTEPFSAPFLLPWRDESGSKQEQGHLLVISGSVGMYGAPTLVCRAALRSGCGYVTLAAPREILPVIGAQIIEPVMQGMESTKTGTIAFQSLQRLLELSARSSAVCLGPGLGSDRETRGLIREFTGHYSGRLVLDADGLNAFVGHQTLLGDSPADIVITPHPGEYARLFGSVPSDPRELIKDISRRSSELGVTIIFKGPPVVIAWPDKRTLTVSGYESALARAGSGDVLTGILGSLLCQNSELNDAVLCAVLLHRAAGKSARRQKGARSLLASELAEALSRVLKEWSGENFSG